VLRLYGEVAKTALQRAARSWLAALSIPIYALLFVGFVAVAGSLIPEPTVLGILVGLAAAACFGGYLTLLTLAVNDSRIRWSDIKSGLHAIWDVASVFFILWIINMVVGYVARGAGSSGAAVLGVAGLAMAIFFNVVPELICHSRNRSLALLQESAGFVLANPFAWFAPNILFAVLILGATGTLSFASPGAFLTSLAQLNPVALITGAPWWMKPLLIAFVHYVMVFRGLLYLELSSGSARMRAFRRRMS
jgi:hypothetical protein